jgi:manganese efflux pump family protein
MSLLESIVLGLVLSLDACAVATATTANGRLNNRRSALRLSFHFGLFQALMPILGWCLGHQVEPWIAPVDHWIAFTLLTLVAIHMFTSAKQSASITDFSDPSKGWMLVTLAVATSLDSLAVGFGLAALGVSVWYPSVIIGCVTMLMSILGIALGTRIGTRWGIRAQLAGAVVLVLIGLRITIAHTLESRTTTPLASTASVPTDHVHPSLPW